VRSINHLQRRFRVPPIVVCSRDLDYAETGEKLALQRAVLIAPLYRAKVVAWLDEGGPALDHVRHAIDDDPTLWDLLDAPLWLDVLAAVSEPSRGESRGGSVAARRTALLDAYVDEALRRGDQSSGYTRADVVRWLGRLAGPGDPVVASRLRLGVVRITDRLPADAVSAIKVGFAGPLMTLVALAGAVVMLRHAGAVVAVTALAAALITVLVWRLAGKRPVGEPPRVRPAGLLGLCAAVTLLGTGLSAVALAITKGLSTLVGLFPGLPKSIDWISVLVVLLTVAVILGCIWAAAMSLDAYRSSKRPAQLLQTFAWAARGTVVAIIVLAVAGDVLGLGYVALISVSARYLFTGACALAFFAVGGAVGIVTDTLSGGEAGYDSQQEHWVASLMAVAMLAGVLITAALHRGWIPRALVFQLVAGGTGAGIGLFLAAQCRRLHLGTLATLCLASVGYLPWRLNRFLRYAARHDLLRSEGRDYRLRHQLFAEHFADRPNPRPPLSLVSPRK